MLILHNPDHSRAIWQTAGLNTRSLESKRLFGECLIVYRDADSPEFIDIHVAWFYYDQDMIILC